MTSKTLHSPQTPHAKQNLSITKLDQIRSLKQSIHNLRMRIPIGIRAIDDEHDEKLKRLEKLLDTLTRLDVIGI